MADNQRAGWLSWCYAITILISAFLVFQVQPVISKMILPWFGGSPAVWTTCMLFFQVLLFGGYAYAHLVTHWLSARWQGAVHVVLIAVALLALPITPDTAWKPAGDADPTWRILLLLAVHVGLPYFLLAATGPLLQAWFSRTHPSGSPYRLYALSNAGSLAALLSYPFVFEPALTTHAQGAFWALGFCAFALFCGYSAAKLWQARCSLARPSRNVAVPLRDTAPSCGATRPQNYPSYDERTGDESEVNWGGRILWLLLPALASMMLLATTNHVCQDVAVIPFLWVAPLSIYLLTFILCFDREAWYSRRWCALGGMLTCGIVSLLLLSTSADHLLGEISVYFLALFFVCMLCHGELVRRKPSPRHLTSFYLSCSAGGALGGIFVALVCPRLFSTYFEMNLCLLLSYLLAVAVFAGHAAKALPKWHVAWKWAGPVAVFAGLLIVVRAQAVALRTEALDSARNFYGVLRVEEVDQTDRQHHARVLYHGRIAHGAQFVLPEKRGIPTTYYSPDSGAGLTLRRFPRRGPLRVGVIGLGVGTLAAYAQADDYYRFYEINPDVVMLAKRYFTFLAESAAPFDVILGDARLSLEREPPQRFDVLVLDAFSGDAIPTHLLTSEVFAVYLRHLRPDGIIAVNISNRYLDLVPVIDRLAADQQIDWVQIRTAGDAGRACSPAHWVLITHNQQFLHDDIVRAASLGEHGQYAHVPLWTDQYSNLFQILK